MSEIPDKISWENMPEKYPIDTSKKSLPEFYDFYNLSQDFLNVYEPSEDTFLLIDSLELELDNLFSQNYFDQLTKITSIELGCGNGLISCCFLSRRPWRKGLWICWRAKRCCSRCPSSRWQSSSQRRKVRPPEAWSHRPSHGRWWSQRRCHPVSRSLF